MLKTLRQTTHTKHVDAIVKALFEDDSLHIVPDNDEIV